MARLGRLILFLRAVALVAALGLGLGAFAFSAAFLHSAGFRAAAWLGLAMSVLVLASAYWLAVRQLRVAR